MDSAETTTELVTAVGQESGNARRGYALATLFVALHTVLLVAGLFVLSRSQGVPVGELFRRHPLGAALACAMTAAVLIALFLASLLVLAKPRASSIALLLPLLAVPLTAALGLRLGLARLLREHPSAVGSEHAAAAFSAGVGQVLAGLAAGAFGSALAFSCAATLVSVRATSRAESVRVGKHTLIGLAVAAAGAVAVALALPRPGALFVFGPVALGLAALALTAATLEGQFSSREAASLAALEGVVAATLSCGAVTLGALALGASLIGPELSRATTDVGVGDRLFVVQQGWSNGVLLLRRAGLAILPLLAATVAIYAGRAVLVGGAARRRLPELLTTAILIVASSGGLRSELGGAARVAAERWTPREFAGTELSRVSASDPQALKLRDLSRVLIVSPSRLRQDQTELGDVSQLDSDGGCMAIASRLQRPESGRLLVAADSTTPYRRMRCLLRALAVGPVAGPEQCAVRWLATPRAPRADSVLPPFDDSKPYPVEIPTQTAGDPCGASPGASRLSINKTGWIYEAPGAPPDRQSASLAVLEKWARQALAGKQVVLDADPEVPAASVLSVAAAIADEHGEVALAVAAPPSEQPAEAPPPQARSGARIRFEPPLVKGNADVPGVTATMRGLQGRFLECYERALKKNPELAGRMVIRFSMQLDGRVSSAGSFSPIFADQKVAECVAAVVGSVGFPPPRGGGATVFFPLVFEPSGSGPAESPPAEPAAAGNKAVQVDFEPVAVNGLLVPDEVQGRLENIKQRVENCAARAAEEPLDGRVSVQFVIGKEGSVTNVTPDPATSLPAGVAGCVYATFYQVGFPKPTDGTVRVTAPVRLRKTSSP